MQLPAPVFEPVVGVMNCDESGKDANDADADESGDSKIHGVTVPKVLLPRSGRRRDPPVRSAGYEPITAKQ